MDKQNHILIRDLAVIVFSVVLAIVLAKTGILKNILTATQELKFIGSFAAGAFFASVFTAAPATVVLGKIAQTNSVFLVAFWGGLGALVGDLIIFRFLKDNLAKDIFYLVNKVKTKRLAAIFKLRLFYWLLPLLGALVIASPLPDELGLLLMGLSKIKTLSFIPLSFFLNFSGILAIGLVATFLK